MGGLEGLRKQQLRYREEKLAMGVQQGTENRGQLQAG